MYNYDCYNTVEGARGLGWASVGIGLTELAAPQVVEKALGLEHRTTNQGILRVLGVRELLHGVGILTESRLTDKLNTGMWARVAGDALDSALLAVTATKTKRPMSFLAVAGAVGAIGVLDLYYAVKTQRG